MSTLAPPVRRGDFFYSSVLYADPGKNPHPRASVAYLAGLLRPKAPNLYTDCRKPSTSLPAKDPSWYFYSSQLIHYGLPVAKDKNGAKMRLLIAMNQFKLEVPPWVSEVEAELKREWDAENKKINKGAGAGVVGNTIGRKRKEKVVQGADRDVKVTVNLSLSHSLSVADKVGMQQIMGVTPKTSLLTKRKRTDSDAHMKTASI